MYFFNHKESTKAVSPYLIEQAQQILQAVGGKANLTKIDACITRLRLDIIDFSKIDENTLTELGSKGNLRTGKNQLHIILGKSSDEIAHLLRAM